MVKFIRVAVAVFCVLCVLAICIAPLVDLPATKLSSDNLIVLLLCSFMAVTASSFIKAFNYPAGSARVWQPSSEQKGLHTLSPLDANSILRR
jgi:hypothetical protein